MKLLIVDDSKNIRTVLKKFCLKIDGISEIFEASDVVDGLESIKKNKPNILILDLMLKTGTGLDVLKSIQYFDNKPYTILYSNFLDDEYKKAAMSYGVTDYFDKSDDFQKLLNLIEKHIDNSQYL